MLECSSKQSFVSSDFKEITDKWNMTSSEMCFVCERIYRRSAFEQVEWI